VATFEKTLTVRPRGMRRRKFWRLWRSVDEADQVANAARVMRLRALRAKIGGSLKRGGACAGRRPDRSPNRSSGYAKVGVLPSGLFADGIASTNVRLWHKADIGFDAEHFRFRGVKRTSLVSIPMSANDP
jgi:hypothetical protein